MSNNAQIYIVKIGIYSKLAVGSKKVQNVINSVALQIVLYLFRNWSDASYDDLLDACTSNSIKLLIYDHFGCTYNPSKRLIAYQMSILSLLQYKGLCKKVPYLLKSNVFFGSLAPFICFFSKCSEIFRTKVQV